MHQTFMKILRFSPNIQLLLTLPLFAVMWGWMDDRSALVLLWFLVIGIFKLSTDILYCQGERIDALERRLEGIARPEPSIHS